MVSICPTNCLNSTNSPSEHYPVNWYVAILHLEPIATVLTANGGNILVLLTDNIGMGSRFNITTQIIGQDSLQILELNFFHQLV